MLLAAKILYAFDPTMIVVSLLVSAAFYALSEVLKPKPKLENQRPAGRGDFNFPTSIEDRHITILFGTEKVDGPNVMWWGDLQQIPIKETIKINLWTQKRTIKGYRFNVGIQFGLCRGPIDSLKRIWIGDTEVFSGSVSDGTISINKPLLFGGDEFGTGGVIGTVRVHPGTETQAVNAYLTAFHNPQPAFRGTSYAVFESGYIGNSTSIKPWSFEVARFPNGLGLTGGHEIVNGSDANIAAIVFELITNDEWGFGYSASKIDAANLRTAGDTLFSEGNGFSFKMESAITAEEFQLELERQMGGVIYLDQQTGLYRINLVRGGYTISSLPKLDASNTIEITNFSRGAWDETTNQLRIKYADRTRDYFNTFAKADDLGNVRVQGGEVVSDEIHYPGVKNNALANGIATRDLKERSIPLAKASVVSDRTLWQTVLGDVIAWSAPTLGLTDVPMRVIRIDRGSLLDGKITLGLVQDVFEWDAGVFGDPQPTLWVAPTQDVTAILAAESQVLDAPYAIIKRDPLNPLALDRLWAFSRSPGGPEISFKIYERHDPVTPSGAFSEAGEVFGFMKIGELGTTLSPADAMPTVTIRLDSTPDTLIDLLAEFSTVTDLDVGELQQLVLIGTEFMGVESIVDQTTFIDLKNVWRGLMDTVPAAHAVNADVFLVFGTAGLSDSQITRGDAVDVQLRSVSRTDESTEGESTTVQLTMADRARKPYPPTELFLNATRYDSTVDFDDLKSGGSNLDERGVEATFIRRDRRTQNEVVGIGTDAGTLDPTFPAENTTKYKLSVFERAPSLLAKVEVFYNLDEAALANAIDAGPNGHDATDVNGVQTAAGHGAGVGTARNFVKADLDHFTLADNADVSFGDEDFEIFCFFRPATISGGQTHGLVAKFESDTPVEVEYGLFQAVDGLFFAVSSDGGIGGGFTQVASSLTLVAGTWYGVWARHDATANTIEIEVVDVANPLRSSTIDSTAHAGGIHDGARPLELGLIRTVTADQYLDGRLSVAGIFRGLLTQLEREVLYNFLGGGNQIPFTGALLGESTFNAGSADSFVSRTEILRSTDGRLPTDLTSEVDTQHVLSGDTLTATQKLAFDHTRAAGTLDNDTNLQVLDTNVISVTYTVPDNGDYVFNIGTALPNGDIEARKNGGAFEVIIAATATTGTTVGKVMSPLTAGNTLEVRHTESVATAETFLEIVPPTSSAGAYGILIN